MELPAATQFEQQLTTLNAEQRRAVERWDRPVLVMAPVGTGKTRVLTLRAANAVEHGVAPESILCLSFTNKAAREVSARLVQQFGKRASALTAKSFHSLCASILRMEADPLGLDANFVIYDEQDCTEIWSRLLRSIELPLARKDFERAEFLFHQAGQKARLSRYDDPTPRGIQKVFRDTALQSNLPFNPDRVDFRKLLVEYVHELRENHALDFTDLIYGVNRLWDEHPDAAVRWQNRYGWIQVDEVQDTSRAEYRILHKLAEKHGQLSFFGDIDQTIYEWRGSAPFEIVDHYRNYYHPEETILVRNYRSTARILEACAAVVRGCPDAVTQQILPQQAEAGEPVYFYAANHCGVEARWIATQVARLKDEHGLAWSDFAVLTRTNFTARDLSAAFTGLGLPHFQVDQQKFFQRAEIKTAMAYLRLLVNRFDHNSLLRFLRTPAKGVGPQTVQDIATHGPACGLRLSDMLDPHVLAWTDPYAPLLEAWATNRLVVFDTETTGLDPATDEIVELAGVRCGRDGVSGTFHELLHPSRPVGPSEAVHGWSDAHLQEHGGAPKEVLARFMAFASDAVWCGHNILSFDVPVLESALSRCGIEYAGLPLSFDSLDIARRFYRLPRYRLGDLAAHLGFVSQPSHRAMDDVLATVELLGHLARRLQEGALRRSELVVEHRSKFELIAEQLEEWRRRSEVDRPADLLDRVLHESGLLEHFRADEEGDQRVHHLEQLIRLVARSDDGVSTCRQALLQTAALAALSTDLEAQAVDGDQVFLLTVHQAKGLEFDTVFLANACDDDFPTQRSRREGRQNEEHRLFYVAISRAKRRLFVSWPLINDRGREQFLTRYARLIPESSIERLRSGM